MFHKRLATACTAAAVLGFSATASAQAIRAGFESTDMVRNDDGSTGLINLGFTVNFFGVTRNGLYVNNNGNVTLDSPLGTYTPFALQTTSRQIIAPFFADVDTRAAGNPTRYGFNTLGGRPAFGVTWRDVDCYNASTTRTVRNYFQVIITDRSDVGAGDFDIEYNYDQIQWETGQASGGTFNCLGGNSARVGYSNGTAAGSFELAGSGVVGAFLDNGPASTALIRNSLNSGGVRGRYIFFVRNGIVVNPCGNGVLDPGEQCDDGNRNSGDGCSGTCSLENSAPIARCRNVDTCAPADACGASASIDNGSSDPEGQQLTFTQNPPSPYGIGSRAVTLIVSDGVNTASCQGTVTIRDCAPPSITCPNPLTRECSGNNAAFVTPAPASASDLCSNPTSATGPAAGSYPVGTTSVIYTARDAANNSTSCNTTISVVDTLAPSIVCPANATAECVDGAATVTTGAATASDVCSAVTVTDPPPASYPLGSSSITHTAQDAHGLSASCTQTVTVQDTTPPSIACPAPATVECTGNSSAPAALADAQASDTCGLASVTDNRQASYGLGTTDVTYTAIDVAGTSVSCTTQVTVQDTTAPSITCPADVSVPFGGAPAADFAGGSASDICRAVTTSHAGDVSVGLCSTIVTRTYTTTDGSLSASCAQTITVNNLFAGDGILWAQPIAKSGASHDTDPSNLADSNAANDTKFAFKSGRSLPVKVHATGCNGDVTGNSNVVGDVAVYTDIGCDGVVDGGEMNIGYNGVGGPGGAMVRITDGDGHTHLHYNLATGSFSAAGRCYVLRVTVSDVSTGESRSEDVLLNATR